MLFTVCEAATTRGRASGASVSEISADVGTFVAVYGQHQLLGVLSVFRNEGQPQFDPHDEERLGTVADLAALARWKARLLEDEILGPLSPPQRDDMVRLRTV